MKTLVLEEKELRRIYKLIKKINSTPLQRIRIQREDKSTYSVPFEIIEEEKFMGMTNFVHLKDLFPDLFKPLREKIILLGIK